MRTLGDDRKAVDVTDRDVTTLDQEMLVREVVYPRLVCALSELRLKIEAFCAEFSEDNVPSELFTTADDISEMVTGLYVFLDRNTNGHKPTEELRR